MSHVRSLLFVTILAVATACASAGGASSAVSASSSAVAPGTIVRPSSDGNGGGATELPCSNCDAIPMPAEITRAVETRIATLKARGGDCSRYGTVLEQSYRNGRITLRPFMWRVGTHLASGEGKPNGDMTLAREIDALNVGVRTVGDVLASMEHEAVHITFGLVSGIEASEEKADQYVRACKG